ncbi:phosphoribosylformylglycinamidine synthase subunit PurL [Dethiosulfovibrio sp. F2B]|uniref:phosphoribosylformylglycinamidine synthase subunit PurL n=1 Tax=Dethiosulfovibrio faecalis TaxID=2720018 RepID=UPI001F2391DA|nr:phosphoribosylformylglycinamidine synthase subunit PurL [Dethiosulfovibrio faecalis]MCF4150297.1 phosphoribosylformylglycinamidine synthase subunit PurL [Dethiosulfovibrio faecalis]
MDYSKAGLRKEEYDALKARLGREPNDLELQIMGVMWSEHCSYKSTKPLLRLFPKDGDRVLLGPGENAGVVDAGDGLGLAFKVESHNHPSAVAPYQGAATGVGGIIRDIMALGARPVASMDGLFFGDPEERKTQALADGVVKGVGGYGNCVGVPTVGGKTVYHESYRGNPLVNAFCAGLVPTDRMVSSQTASSGQKVLILGSKTGRDGIAGAAFASVELAEDGSGVPSIQIGDPFAEKLLIEACLELRDKDLLVSMQDMGAAGILSSSSEIAAKSGIAMTIDFDAVPLRAEGMEPWEIALSESQERMLLIVEPEKVDQVMAVAGKWELDCAVIGETEKGDHYRILWKGDTVADMPASVIGSDCPEIPWPSKRPKNLEDRWNFDLDSLPLPENWNEEILNLLGSHSHRSRKEIFEQYDSMVQTNTVIGPGSPVSAVRIEGSDRIAVMSMEAQPFMCWLDPYNGSAEVVARSCRALAVAGAKPAGTTDCLNFPSPEKPEQFWTLEQSAKGMAEACSSLNCPVVSGNVSLYNETANGPILPTPLVGTVGFVENPEELLSSGNWRERDRLFYVGMPNPRLDGGSYLQNKTGRIWGKPLDFDGELENEFILRAIETAKRRAASSGMPIAGGGLAVALAKEAGTSGLGASISIPFPTRRDVLIFGEGGPRAVYSVPKNRLVLFRALWKGYAVTEIGQVGGNRLTLDDLVDLSVSEIRESWNL